MQMHAKKLLAVSLILLSVLGGCKKNKQKQFHKKQSLTSRITKPSNNKNNQSADPLNLDSDSMKSFALDDKLSKHETTTAATSGNNMFSWENVDAEKSRNQFKTLHFKFDKDTVEPSEEPGLLHNVTEAKKMIKNGKTIVIEGHACHSAGSAAYNMAISERRARNVAQKFAEHNIDAGHIKIAPRGQEMPVRKGGNRQEQWVNRRVETYAIDSN